MRKRHRYVTVIVNGDTGEDPGHGPAPQRGCAVNVFDATGRHRCVHRRSQSRRQRRLQGLQVRHRRPPGPRSATCADRFRVVRWFSARGSPRCAATASAALKAPSPAFDPEVFRARFKLLRRGDTLTEPQTAPASTPSSTPTPASTPAGRHCKSSTASTSPTTTKAALKALGRFCDLYETGEAARVPRHSRHHHRLVRRDPRLAPHRPGLQRPHRGHQQPAPSAQAHRPRLHQPHQLRSPRHPRVIMTPTGASNPQSHINIAGPTTCSKSCGAPPTASPTQPTSKPEDC